MYTVGRIVGSLFNLALHTYVIYDAYKNVSAGNSAILDLIAFVILLSSKEIIRQVSWSYRALEFLAASEIEKKEERDKLLKNKKIVNNIFNDITKDL